MLEGFITLEAFKGLFEGLDGPPNKWVAPSFHSTLVGLVSCSQEAGAHDFDCKAGLANFAQDGRVCFDRHRTAVGLTHPH